MTSLGSFNKKARFVLVASRLALLCIVLNACTNLPEFREPSNQHISLPGATAEVDSIPPLAETSPLPPPPSLSKSSERYSVVVNNVLAQEILFALARDAKLNIEINPNITGMVTMNLIDQTITEILDAISRQIDMRYELKGGSLIIMPDTPYLKTYQIDYPNVSRKAANSSNLSSSISGIGQSSGGGGGGSSSSIENKSDNLFWETLTKNITDLLRETDKILPKEDEGGAAATAQPAPPPPQQQMTAQQAGGSPNAAPAGNTGGTNQTGNQTGSALNRLPATVQMPVTPEKGVTFREAASVIANPETGTISVRATSRQHANVREFLDKVILSAKRQVLIEATLVEVTLTDEYQQGIDWSLVSKIEGLTLIKPIINVGTISPNYMGTLRYDNDDSVIGNITSAIRILETFGKLHVLSSPKLSVLNNQTSLLKVVDEVVYFTVEVEEGTPATAYSPATPDKYTSTIHTVPVGFHMYVTPQIGSDEDVTLNLRPTISRITRYVEDPTPALAGRNFSNLVPEIQTREIESILRVHNNEIAVLGGLMQDTRTGDLAQVPGISRLFGIGELFKDRNGKNKKSELVIFLRPVILNQERQHAVLRQYQNPMDSPEWQRNNITAKKVSP